MWSSIVPYIPLIIAGIQAAGGAAKGKQESDQAQTSNDLNRDVLKERTAMDTANFNRQTPGVQMGNSVRGDILSNVQPTTMTGSGRDLKVTGGLSPSLLSDNSRQLGALTSRQALLAAMGQQDSQGNIGGVPNPYQSPGFQPKPLYNDLMQQLQDQSVLGRMQASIRK